LVPRAEGGANSAIQGRVRRRAAPHRCRCE